MSKGANHPRASKAERRRARRRKLNVEQVGFFYPLRPRNMTEVTRKLLGVRPEVKVETTQDTREQ